MKKYLMSGIAAFAIAAAFTSCSKSTDLYDQGAVDEKNRQEQEQKIENNIDQAKAKYAAAFEKAFGKVGANVDWGFSSNNANTRALTRALGDYDNYKGSLEPSFPSWSPFTFPTDCDASKFLAAVPGDVNKLPADGEARGGTYFIDATTTKVNMNSSAGVIYVNGTVDLSGAECFEVTQNTEIYLIEGATLKLSEKDANKLKAIIYIAGTAKLETANRLKMDKTSKVYNHGTINAGAFEVNNTSFLYNVGTLNASNGLVYVANSNSAIVNDGTIIAGDVEVAGSGHVQNNAEWTVNGTTTVNSNSATWVNNGKWTTDYYKYTAGSENVINNCFLEVKEDFDMNVGESQTAAFKIDAGGGVLTKNFNGGKLGSKLSGPWRIIMGSKAVFKVTGTAAFASSKSGTWPGGPKYGYGVFGPDAGDYAVFQATHIVKADNETDKKVEYGGNLYVSADDHFASTYNGNENIGLLNGYDKSNIFTTNASDEFSTGKPDINIQETPCNPGFTGKAYYRVIAEDLNADQASDFDFNDVVFDVIKAENGKTTLKLVACGGIYKLTVAGEEVHKLFGETTPNADGNYSMFNTGDGKTHDPVEFDITGTYDTPELINNIEIIVYKPINGTVTPCTLDAKKGVAASKILVDSSFGVVPERHSITDQYGNFTSYVQGTWDSVLGGKWWLKK